MSPAPNPAGSFSKTRVEAFSDGVIAIIVTILVLEVKVPALPGPDLDAQEVAALRHALPLVLAYVASFAVVLVFWVAHHHFFHSLKRVDRNLLWLNGLFLMLLAFVPAPTALVGAYPSARPGTIVYGGVLALAGLAFNLMRRHATHHGALLHEAMTPEAAAKGLRRGMLSPLVYGLGMLLALVDTRLAWGAYLLVPVIFIVPGAFDRAAHGLEE